MGDVRLPGERARQWCYALVSVALAVCLVGSALPASAEAREFLRYGYLEKIEVEDSPRGYFQLAVLRLLGRF